MKSAWELAMERSEASHGPMRKLTDEQKEAIADATSKGEARIAELRIMRQPPIDAAKASGDLATAALLEEHLRGEILKSNNKLESEKADIRGE